MNRKVKSFKECFYRNDVWCQSYNKCSRCSLSVLTQTPTIVLILVHCLSIICSSKSAQAATVSSGGKLLLLLWKPRSWF